MHPNSDMLIRHSGDGVLEYISLYNARYRMTLSWFSNSTSRIASNLYMYLTVLKDSLN